MNSVSMRQIRETLARYVREEDNASGRSKIPESASVAVETSVPSSTAKAQTKATAGLKEFLRSIPVVHPILRGVYRVVKLPGRVALIARQLQEVYDLQVGLTKLHDRVDALSLHVSALQQRQEKVLSLLESEAQQLHTIASNASNTLVALHEKYDSYQQDLCARVDAIKPVIHAGEDLVISRIDDFIMAFPAEEWRLVAFQILQGQLEPGLFALMKSTILEGMVVVDIGANIGTYTLLALQAIGTRGMVVSYEPTPRVFDILKNNVQINGFLETGRVDLRQKAVSDGSTTRQPFFLMKHSLTHSSLYGGDQSTADGVEVIEVDTVALDKDLADLPHIDVVKIDAEGAEPEILRGMRRIVERNPDITIFIEFAPAQLIRARVDLLGFLGEIRALGLKIQEVVEPSGALRSTTDEALCNCFSVNLMLRRAS